MSNIIPAMTRALPWKRNASSISVPKPISTPLFEPPPTVDPHVSSRPTSQAPRPVTGDEGAQATYPPHRISAINAKPQERSQSSSPPPAPPEEKFMIHGLEGDDIWRMVEDEFLSVAGTFTKHLHRAEYKRLRRLAESQNTKTINQISRPVTGDKTDAVKRRQIHQDLDRCQGGAIKHMRGANDSDDDEPSPWAGTALQGLMDSPRKRAPRLLADAVRNTTTAKPPAVRGRLKNLPVSQSRSFNLDTRSNSLEHWRRQGASPRNRGGAAKNDQMTQSEDDSDDDLDATPAYPARDRGPTLRAQNVALAADADSSRVRRFNSISLKAESSAATQQSATDARSIRAPTLAALPHPHIYHDDSDSSDGIFAQARKRRKRLCGPQRRE